MATSTNEWREILGWTQDQLEEIRFAGFSYLKEGRYEKALVFFKALVILDPLSVYDAQTLGALYVQTGEGKIALKVLENALNLNPDDQPTLLNKVKALLMLGQKVLALQLLYQLEKSPDQTVANDASALIATYS